MPHEPSGSRPLVQQAAGRRCPSCRAVKPLDDFPARAGIPAGCCASCRRRSATVARRHRRRTLRQVARRAEAGYRALLAQHTHQRVVAMQPERPECQCLACAQLQHQQANDTLLLFTLATVVAVGGLVWLVGQVAGLLLSGAWPEVPLSELPGILVRLRDHAGDPAAAWPAGVRDELPGPLGMYATLAGILAMPLALGALAWWLHQPPPAPRPPATPAPGPGDRSHRPRIPPCRCCRRPSTTGRRRDRDYPGCAANWTRRPRELWRGRAGTGRHQPRGGPPLRSHPPARPLVCPLASPPA